MPKSRNRGKYLQSRDRESEYERPRPRQDDRTRQDDHVNGVKSLLRECCIREDLLEALPDELLLMFGTDYCGICSKGIGDNMGVLMAHYSSIAHCKKMSTWVKEDCAKKELPIPSGIHINIVKLKPREVACELCNEEFSTPEEAQNHYMGKQHRLVVKEERMVKDPFLLVAPEGVHKTQRLRQREKIFFVDPDASKRDEFYCALCKVQTTTESQLRQHKLGAHHRRKVEMKEKNSLLLERIVNGNDCDSDVEDFTAEDMEAILSAYN